jgi:hypothetical protein
MTGPFREGGIVMEGQTSDPSEYIQFHPSILAHDQWLHSRDELDPTADLDTIREEYALPTADSYMISIYKVPAGERIEIGTLGSVDDHAGGADLVRLPDRETIPEEWLVEETPLATLR